ncbi:MAG: TetR family transcriptional regulator [Acidobacteriaceae bacterium]
MPISDCEVRDPRMRRTRQLLQGALRKLMQSKNFDEIAVQDITEAATVNRVTFYDHYTDKYALLEAMVAGGFHQLLHERNVCYDGTCPSGASAVILATCDYLAQSHGDGTECRRHNAFEPLIEAALTSAIRRVLIAGVPKGTSASSPPPDMIATAASWAIYGAVKEWFNTPGRLPAEEVVPLVMQLIVPILESAGPRNSPAVASAPLE